jgi:hypothetical protein
VEGGLPFVTFIDPDKMVSMPEIDFGEELSLLRTIKEVRDARKWITVFLGEFVESPEVDTKSEGPIFLLDKKDRSTTRRSSGADKSIG